MCYPPRLEACKSLALSALLHLVLLAWLAPHLQAFSGASSWSRAIDAVLVASLKEAAPQKATQQDLEPDLPSEEPPPRDSVPDRATPSSQSRAPPQLNSEVDDPPKTAHRSTLAPRTDGRSTSSVPRPAQGTPAEPKVRERAEATGVTQPAAADAPSAENARSRAEDRFLTEFREAIAARRFYPPAAQAHRIEGQVTLGLLLAQDGGLSQVEIRASSGYPILDEAALETLRRLGRFKPIPPEIRRTSWPIRVPITFALR